MRIDKHGNMELTEEEDADLLEQLEIPPSEHDDPPVEIECVSTENDVATFKATNTKTGKHVLMVFDLMNPD
ncbi:hypothetical protein [Methylococcus geothermalis]|uniref:Uncharacterized protein n=1 Tax=Methylococcus geothermalis TaxID=2681310 RepID=A0A858Q8T6_9GAMM|nr:hypothetical protein [Methylococcus geothermalis]QJD30164.1 hypothetical protein GNH96_09400 [Methylococcus geothermalis]